MTELPELTPGLSGTLQYQVKEASTARKLGSGSVDVLATPELVRLMEAAAVAALNGHLPPDVTSVGVSLNIKHIAPTPVGCNVKVRAALTEVLECPVPNASYPDSLRFGKPERPPFWRRMPMLSRRSVRILCG